MDSPWRFSLHRVYKACLQAWNSTSEADQDSLAVEQNQRNYALTFHCSATANAVPRGVR